jgi:probable metal-binding protein
MSAEIHGHEVMNMMVASGKIYTKEDLRSDIIQKFGENTRFYTCSQEHMNADALIEFLRARGKFQEVAGGFQTDAGSICDH